MARDRRHIDLFGTVWVVAVSPHSRHAWGKSAGLAAGALTTLQISFPIRRVKGMCLGESRLQFTSRLFIEFHRNIKLEGKRITSGCKCIIHICDIHKGRWTGKVGKNIERGLLYDVISNSDQCSSSFFSVLSAGNTCLTARLPACIDWQFSSINGSSYFKRITL